MAARAALARRREHRAHGVRAACRRRVYEIRKDGSEGEWADVLAYDRPSSFTLAWRPYETLGERPPTELEVRFIAEGDGTRVELEHRGWERLGDEAAESQQGYDSGWDHVLGRYVAAFG